MKEYLTVEGYQRAEIEIKHSKFIASACHITSREEGAEFLEKISKEFWDATHNCYAYCSDKDARELKFSDNGEPSGTAGQPILDVITKSGLREVIIVVTRYFGGIKLGAGGLVGAYSSAAATVIKQMQKVKMLPSIKVALECGYNASKKCETLPEVYSGVVVEREYSENVKYVAVMPTENVDKLKNAFMDLTKGQGVFTILGEEYRKVIL